MRIKSAFDFQIMQMKSAWLIIVMGKRLSLHIQALSIGDIFVNLFRKVCSSSIDGSKSSVIDGPHEPPCSIIAAMVEASLGMGLSLIHI